MEIKKLYRNLWLSNFVFTFLFSIFFTHWSRNNPDLANIIPFFIVFVIFAFINIILFTKYKGVKILSLLLNVFGMFFALMFYPLMITILEFFDYL